MMSKKSNSFLILTPNSKYYISMFSELVSQLLNNYPNHKIIIAPLRGIKYCYDLEKKSILSFARFIKRYANYYSEQLYLGRDVKKLFDSFNQLSSHPNVEFISLASWLSLRRNNSFELNKEFKEFGRDLADYRLDNIKIGDLIIDTYLRFKPSPSLSPKDSFIKEIITRSIKLYSYYKNIFTQNNIITVFGTCTTYIYHGIPLRLAQKYAINSFTFGGSTTFYEKHTKDSFLSHYGDHTKYSNTLSSNILSQNSMLKAKVSLDNRIFGRKDMTTSYMVNLSNSNISLTNIQNERVIFLHDFFDSPHIYRWMLHNDFYHWATDTINTLINSGEKVFIKPHPNELIESIKVVSCLKNIYRNSNLVEWIPAKTSNKMIFDQKPLLTISVYGSVIVESAYCKVKAISAGDHPAYNLPICYNPSSLDDYHHKILNVDKIETPSPDVAINFLAQHFHEKLKDESETLLSFLDIDHVSFNSNQDVVYKNSTKKFIASSINKLLELL